MNVRFTINSQAVEVEAQPMARLLDVLREELRLTGTFCGSVVASTNFR